MGQMLGEQPFDIQLAAGLVIGCGIHGIRVEGNLDRCLLAVFAVEVGEGYERLEGPEIFAQRGEVRRAVFARGRVD